MGNISAAASPPLISFGSTVHLASAKAKLMQLLGHPQVNETKAIGPQTSEPSPESSITAGRENQPAPEKSALSEPIPASDILTTIIRYESSNDRKFHRII